jgi:Ras-related protein Rab-32
VDENPTQKLGSVMDSSEEVKRALQVVEVDIHRNNVHFDSVPPMNGIPSTENGLADPSTESVTAGKLSNTQNVTQTQAMTSETNSNHKEREIPKTCPSTPSTTPITKKPFADSLIENGDPRISLTPMRNVEESELVISTESHDSDGPLSPGYDVSNRRQSSESFTDSFKHLQPFNFNLGAIHEGKRERLYKVLVVGELGTGKTSIIKRYVHQFFSQHYRATIGVDFALKVLRWDPETVVRLQLWDIAGQERFGSMTRVYYKEAVGAFVVFDVTRSGTLDAVQKWKNDLDSKVVLPDGRPIPTVLLANKSDQPKEGMAANREKMNEFCKQNGFAAWFETSAKENIHIDEAASFLVSKILEMDRWSQEPMARDPEKLNLGMNGKYKPSDGSLKNCAC